MSTLFNIGSRISAVCSFAWLVLSALAFSGAAQADPPPAAKTNKCECAVNYQACKNTDCDAGKFCSNNRCFPDGAGNPLCSQVGCV